MEASMDVAYASTAELAEAIRRKHISAAEVLDVHLDRIARFNPALNAVSMLHAQRAKQRAREADAALARGESWGSLHGVPFLIKDAHETAGMKTTVGFPPFANYMPDTDSPVVARLKAAGAVLMGKTNVATLLADYQSNNPLFGKTCNPWNLERTAGGSSGGAAAAIAAGMTPFDIGTDLAGSIRLPSHFCGVYGLKPTENRVPRDGSFPNPGGGPRVVRIMASIGPMARTAADLSLLYGIIAGSGGRDPDVCPLPVERAPAIDPAKLSIGLAPTFPGLPAAEEIEAAAAGLVRLLEQAGAAIEEAALPALDLLADIGAAFELIGMMTGAAEPDNDKPATLVAYLAALDRRDRSILAWEECLASYDALVCPAAPMTAFHHCQPGTRLDVDGAKVDYGLAGAHGVVFNYSGHPCVTIPVGLDRQGLPIGLQLVGRRYGEGTLLGIAALAEQLTGGFRRPPGY
jgi:amidase